MERPSPDPIANGVTIGAMAMALTSSHGPLSLRNFRIGASRGSPEVPQRPEGPARPPPRSFPSANSDQVSRLRGAGPESSGDQRRDRPAAGDAAQLAHA